jgi:hypothetical protein
MTMPDGALQGSTGLAAVASVIDATNGRVMWSAKAPAAPVADVTSQIAEATKALPDATRQTEPF